MKIVETALEGVIEVEPVRHGDERGWFSETWNAQRWRDAGYDIPIWVPEAGSQRKSGGEYDQMPFWAVRKTAVALGDFPEDGFVEKTNDDGSTYPGFPGPKSYNNAPNPWSLVLTRMSYSTWSRIKSTETRLTLARETVVVPW